MKLKTENANGRWCSLVYAGDGKFKVRVYDEVKLSMCKEYDIELYDLMFQICDDDAYLYEDGDKRWIDYSPDTLGIKLP